MIATQPSTVLFLAANPVQVQLLQLGEECRAIEDKIRAAKFRDQLRFRSRWAARPDDLLQALNEDCPSVLHFSGHGAGDQGLCFQADDGSALKVSADGLASVMRAAGSSVVVVFLNACYTEVQAQALVAHVPCVIGMSNAIGDEAAIIYAASFYRALAFGKSVANAHEQGIAALALPSLSGQLRDITLLKPTQCAVTPRLLTRPDMDADSIYIVQERSERARCTIIIKATLREFNAGVLSRVTNELRQLTGDLTLQIIDIDEGSVRLTVALSPEAARILAELKTNGQLDQLCGFQVTAVLASPEAKNEALSVAAAGSRGRVGGYEELCTPTSSRSAPIMTARVLAELIERATGLAIDRGGVSVALDRFVTERLHALGLQRIEDYVTLADDPAGSEQRRLIDAITVPHTWFYRDPEQLQTIAKLLAEAPAGRLAVWVAGCATGEEAYTLAMIGRSIGRDVSVLATDVNETALKAARRGVYSMLAVRDVPPNERRWLSPQNNRFSVDAVLRQDVNFVRHNLVDPPPQATNRDGWDLVVCRNVLIYFAAPTVVSVLEHFARSLREGGSLVVGASEVVFEPPPGLELASSGNRLVLRRLARDSPSGLPGSPTATVRPPHESLPPAPAMPRPSPSAPPPAPATNPGVPHEALRAAQDDNLVATLARGHALFERGEIADALQVYAELVRSYPSVAEVWLFLGIARYASGEMDAAANALRTSLCLDPALWPAGFYLARAYERLGRRADALQQYDLVAVDELQPLALQSTSAVINELRAFRHDFRTAARRVAAQRAVSSRRLK